LTFVSRIIMKTLFLFLLSALALNARLVEYDLEITRQKWSPGAPLKAVSALTINGGIPGPTLRFQEGDTARIRVHNRLASEETSIHWHGIVLPVEQDGVPHVTTPPILPGGSHTFEFKLLHSGTYWYHSHTGLQEQEGVYGSIVVDPAGGEPVKADRDHVVVLSDWTLERGDEVMRSLRRGTEWYELKKGSIQSLTGAAKAGALSDFFSREKSRMPAMDISDVAYDAFLANGRKAIHLPGKPGDKVRLRFINAAASTYFYLQSATGPLRIVAADGPPVKPIHVRRLLVGMAETYDIIVTIPKAGSWEVRATAQDGSGHASVFLGNGDPHPAPEIPRPDNYRMDHHLMAAMDEMDMDDMPAGHQAEEPERPLPPYTQLRALRPTAFPKSNPRRTLEMRLTGDMERYIWSFNGKTFAQDGVIPIKKGEVIRLEFINDTMMHHPIHLHGHFFRVLDGQGTDAPLKHTIDVPPMGKRTIEFLADNPGDWLLHCHLLYHMHAGMTRIFSYQDENWTPPTQGKIKPGTENVICTDNCCVPASARRDASPMTHSPHAGGHDHDPLFFYLEGSIQSHMSEGAITMMNTYNDFFAAWETGHRDDTEYEIDLGWRRYFNPNFSALLGWTFTNHEGEEDRAFAGVEYRLPYLIDSTARIDSEGDLRIGLGKSLQITDRLNVFAEVQYDTGSLWEWTTGATWMLSKQFSIITQYHSEYGFGGGLQFRF
jgi:FtsP/CotA-like multicopper oxidase with cupredoxin domain